MDPILLPLVLGLGLSTTADIVSTRTALRGGRVESGILMRFADHSTPKMVLMQTAINSGVLYGSVKLRTRTKYWWLPILTATALHTFAAVHNNRLSGPDIHDLNRRITELEQRRKP